MDILKLNLDGAEPPPPGAEDVRLHVALLAALSTLLLSLLIRYVASGPLIPEIVSDFLFAVIPISIVEAGVSLFGEFAKHLAFAACIFGYLLGLLGIGILFQRLAPPLRKTIHAVLLSLAAWTASGLTIPLLVNGGLFGYKLGHGALWYPGWTLVVAAALGASLVSFGRMYSRFPDQKQARVPILGSRLIGRRQIFKWMGMLVVAIAALDIAIGPLVSWLRSGNGRVKNGNGVFPNISGLSLEITPTDAFFQVSKNASDPFVDGARWRFEISGMVGNPISMDLDQLKQVEAVEQYATLECISNEVGGDLTGNALWRGVGLRGLLEQAELQAGVVDIVLTAADGYTDSIPLDRATAPGTMLAYEMNGAPLSQAHGFPLRLIVPGIYGMKNAKWIRKIEAVAYDYKGYWQSRGWDDRAEYKTMSRFDVTGGSVAGQSTAIAGIAFAGDRGIKRVEVSIDGGMTWQDGSLKQPLSPYAWSLWHFEWVPTPGKHQLVVRATDGNGVIQTSKHAPPIPDGSSGYDSRIITIKA